MVNKQEEKVTLEITCIVCHTKHSFEVNKKDLIEWEQGKKIQYAFPYLSDNERELLISKVCGKCFDEIFKDTE